MLLAKTNQVDMESTNLNRSDLEENKYDRLNQLERIIIFYLFGVALSKHLFINPLYTNSCFLLI